MTALDVVAWRSAWRMRSVEEKAALCFGLLACAVTLPAWPTVPLVLLAVAASARHAGLPRWHLVTGLRAPAVFIVVAAASTAVTMSPTIGLSASGLADAVQTAARAIAATSATLLFASSTPVSAWVAALRRLGVPATCTDVMTVMYRMVFLLLESLAVVRQSQVARLGYRTLGLSVRSAGLMTAAALTRAWSRALRLEQGLSSRSFGGSSGHPTGPAVSYAFVAMAVVTVSGVAVLGWLGGSR
ncbi:energy-coupling factor transporter transmembrane component T family protein [Mycolicibacterium nivoides]|uniref:Energy-coupling factor transporter transmembrane component T family protein n=1 Tax=Mycolicibacterium nivoides TaxID=2487344 RepID=A0ABW9LNN2_9MYCO